MQLLPAAGTPSQQQGTKFGGVTSTTVNRSFLVILASSFLFTFTSVKTCLLTTPTHVAKSQPPTLSKLQATMRSSRAFLAISLAAAVYAFEPRIRLPVPVLYAQCQTWNADQTFQCVFSMELLECKRFEQRDEFPFMQRAMSAPMMHSMIKAAQWFLVCLTGFSLWRTD